MGEDHPWLLDKYFDRVIEYLEWSIHHSRCNQTQSLAHLALGVLLFEKAVQSPVCDQKKMLLLARYYLEETFNITFSKTSREIIMIYQALVEVCLDNLPDALKFLTRAGKISESPLPIWKILSSVYKALGQNRVVLFYTTKIKSYKENHSTIL